MLFTSPVTIWMIIRQSFGKDPRNSDSGLVNFFSNTLNLLQYFNNALNFFLYCVTGSKFRNELVRMFKCCKAEVPAVAGNVRQGSHSVTLKIYFSARREILIFN